MKITIIHGENSSASFDFLVSTLNSFKIKGITVNRISKESPFNITETLSAGDLFNKESLFLIEDPSKISVKDIQWIIQNADGLPGNLLIYNDAEFPDAFINKLSAVSQVKEFRLPKSLFVFLDSFLPGRTGHCLQLFHGLLKKEPPEFIFAVFCKHVRDLYWVKVAAEDLAYPAWRISKLKQQSSSFSEEKLKKALNSLARIDFSAKTSSQDISSSLDLLIVSLLQ